MNDDSGVLAIAARLYYEHGWSQAQIAGKLGVSRPTVSRMLDNARRRGIVNIRIEASGQRDQELENKLIKKFRLNDSRVVPPGGDIINGPLDHLGRAAAAYIEGIVEDGMTIGVSPGGSVAATIGYLASERALQVTVVELLGAFGIDKFSNDTPELARAAAAAFQARHVSLRSPSVLSSTEVRDLLAQEPMIRRTLDIAAKADVAIAGITSLEESFWNRPEDSELLREQLDPDSRKELVRAGAVGYICGTYFGPGGETLPFQINQRTLGIGPDGLRAIPTVIVVAGGIGKVTAIMGALRGRFVSVLVTDAGVASRLLEND